MAPLDYLLVGHITCDLLPDGKIVGGTVAYSGRVAQALGYETAVLTSCQKTYEGLSTLAGIDVEVVPSEYTSTFENIYTANGRIQTLHDVAAKINSNHVPAKWKDPAIIHQFPDSIIGLTPQGWMRQWDENGRFPPNCEQKQINMFPTPISLSSVKKIF